MALDVAFTALAALDIEAIEAIIAKDSPSNAVAYIGRLRIACERLATFPNRGVARDDLASGVRMLVFERRVIILYSVGADDVLILRLVYAGRRLDDLWPERRLD